jgi:pyrrolidone-carboxylate peptidase
MKKETVVVVSGFKPFGSRRSSGVNASWTVANHICTKCRSKVKAAHQFAVEWTSTVKTTDDLVSKYQPDIWLAFGENANASQFQIELKADAQQFKKDTMPTNEKDKNSIIEFYKRFPTPIWNNVELCANLAIRLNSKGYPTIIRHSAGGYICEQMLHTLLSNPNNNPHWPSLVLFIHVPIETAILHSKHGKQIKNSEKKLKKFGIEILDQVLFLYNKRA